MAENSADNGGQPVKREFPKKNPLGVTLKAIGAALMIVSFLSVLFYSWHFGTFRNGTALLMAGWVGGFMLFILGRKLE